ncbi:ABC transporter permease [Hymenobacter sp. GOD-10R]|uniref:ABC transporter permease n=1 Tax=Hymenobacter sp. GOD-10R TaxID=3093922 RepID=UPI002D79AFDF|nr:ABC transporter permease [Hymenobacter sp. GOD-10R]WRQ31752.1 ABC transporter permease [Hymenobacter sp. GOD-10R]
MSQLYYVVKRELSIRVKTKSFLLFSLISPILFVIPFLFAIFMKPSIKAVVKVGIVSELAATQAKDTILYRGLIFFHLPGTLEQAKKQLSNRKNDLLGVLYIPADAAAGSSSMPIKLYVPQKDAGRENQYKDIEAYVNQYFLQTLAKNIQISQQDIEALTNYRSIYPVVVDYKKSNVNMLAASIAYTTGMLLYLLLILFNNSILKSVAEEKQNRLAEVLSMHVKPFNLMFGKILGSGFVSLMQMTLWVFMAILYLKGLHWLDVNFFGGGSNQSGGPFNLTFILNNVQYLPIQKMLTFIPLFFIFGFLLNGAFTTAIGVSAAADSSASLSFLGNIINIMSIYVAMFSASFPTSMVTKIAMYVPFFSPMAIPTILPYGVPVQQLLLSLSILVLSFLAMIYVTGKIYRLSITANGNPVSLKNIWRSLATSN